MVTQRHARRYLEQPTVRVSDAPVTETGTAPWEVELGAGVVLRVRRVL